jgi:L-2-hydroxycarboxylate dehydrogenase (NAD+)
MTEILIDHENLRLFSQRVMMAVGASEDDAFHVADNLVVSNLRGIDSHGVGRLKRYVEGTRLGYIIPDARPTVTKESPVIANVDAHNGLGQPAGVFGMELAIKKALGMGVGIVTVFGSNHFGFAGYYAMMALKDGLVGISMTNSEPLVVPTFSKNAMVGTNPIALAAPTERNRPWVLDMATSVVPSGKLEVYNRLGKDIPLGWATNEEGVGTTCPSEVLRNMYGGSGKGGICPLGGEGELHGGHKGYGLAVMVEVLCGIISGANYARNVSFMREGKAKFPRVGHFFMALDPKYFIDPESFQERMDDLIDRLTASEKASGQTRVYVHGEKEFEMYDHRIRHGIPIDPKTAESLLGFSKEFDIELQLVRS